MLTLPLNTAQNQWVMRMSIHFVDWENDPEPSREPNSLLLEEYKLIQDKIDKLGEDKFKVRSWCFTLLTGGAVAVKYLGILDGNAVGPWLLLAFLPAVAAFHLVELRQRQIGRQYGFRAAEIERIWRSRQQDVENRSSTPNLATYLIQAGRNERSIYSLRANWNALKDSMRREFCREDFPETALPKVLPEKVAPKNFRAAPKKTKPKKIFSLVEFFVVNSEDAFYWVQYLLVVIFTIALIFGVKIQPKNGEKHEAPEIKENANELNIDGVRPINHEEVK